MVPKNIHTLPPPFHGASERGGGRKPTLKPPSGGEYGYFLEKYDLMSSFNIQIVKHLFLSDKRPCYDAF